MPRLKPLLAAMVIVALGGASLPASADQTHLRVGVAVDPMSADPHFLTGPDNVANRHVFDRLVHQDERQRPVPGLATSWRAVDDSTWEFKLRPNVKFHDGSAFTAEDVAFSFDRAREVKRTTSPVSIYLREVAKVAVVDPLTIRITTTQVFPMLPTNLSAIAIIPRSIGTATATEDFNSGKSTIGTGPYRFVDFVPGDRITLERFDGYWGPKAEWQKVTLKAIKNVAARHAALLSGDVDLINAVSPIDFAALEKDPRFNVASAPASRLIHIQLDSNRDQSPFVNAKDGSPLPRNPFKDVRVRQAMSIAINRTALIDRILEGQGVPAGQLLPDGFVGVSPNIGVDKYDPDGARKLLADAGFPNGFATTFHCPSDRFIRADAVCQAVAQMWTRAGIDVRVELLPGNVFLNRAQKLEFSLFSLPWTSDTGDITSPLRALLATFDAEKGFGQANRGRYSNPAFDQTVFQAFRTMDDQAREGLFQKAVEIAIKDQAVVPLFYQMNTWASQKHVVYQARAEEFPLATSASLKK